MDGSLNPYESPCQPLDALPVEVAMTSAPPGAVSFQGSVTVEEALEADGILLPWQKIQLYAVGIALGGLAAICLAMVIARVVQGDDNFLAWLVGLMIFGSLWTAIVVGRLGIHRKARALYRQRFGIYGETTGYVTAEEIYTRTDVAWSTILWPAFKGYKASRRVILLFWRNSPGFLILTRGKFASDDDWGRVRGIVSKRLPYL